MTVTSMSAAQPREKTVMIAWLREYMSEHREPSVAPRYVRDAIADFEAQVEAMRARLRDLGPHPRVTQV